MFVHVYINIIGHLSGLIDPAVIFISVLRLETSFPAIQPQKEKHYNLMIQFILRSQQCRKSRWKFITSM